MENSTTIIKVEIAFLLKELKKLIKLYSNKVDDYLKDVYYFQHIEEMINDEGMNRFSKLNLEYFYLAKEFRNFVLRYSVSHDHITESVLYDIVRRPIEYILHRRQSDYDTDSETDSDSEDEEIIDNEEIINNILQHLINDNLKHQVNNFLEKQSISNNLKQLLINNLLKRSIIDEILKDSTISNEESLINDILNKKTVNNEKNNNNEMINNENNNNANTFVETQCILNLKKQY